MTRRGVSILLLLAPAGVVVFHVTTVLSQGLTELRRESLAKPFVGVTTNGSIVPGLFSIRATGVPTEAVKISAESFLAALTEEQRAKTEYPVGDIEWRKWDNVHRAPREGVRFGEMTEAQKEKAYALLAASLSARGLQKTRDVMRLNEHLAELVQKPEEYGEGQYYLTVMGEPSVTEPWGWQLDGHHLVINYFVLGDQVVMTPAFMGSEPVEALSGKYKGTVVMKDEQDKGWKLLSALTDEQRKLAILPVEKTRGNALAQAYNDNLALAYAGISTKKMTEPQRALLLDLIFEYVSNMDDGHARVRMEEVRAHLDETHFAWIGDTGTDAVFYYRVHSPVILIEFDHQGPIALEGPPVANRRHVHTVVRTPNGNDYGTDLLRQHYEAHASDPAHGHQN
jgi:hypothetical protein